MIHTATEFEELVGRPLSQFAFDCHSASLALAKAMGAPARVLRGRTPDVRGQHSWVALCSKTDVYRKDVAILDPTLWSYTGEEPYVFVGPASQRPHRPHGYGSIFTWGRPHFPVETVIELLPGDRRWSSAARAFLEMIGPLDVYGWAQLFGSSMEDWPAGEIIEAAYKDDTLRALIPIDRVGMLTDLNPGGLYLP